MGNCLLRLGKNFRKMVKCRQIDLLFIKLSSVGNTWKLYFSVSGCLDLVSVRSTLEHFVYLKCKNVEQ